MLFSFSVIKNMNSILKCKVCNKDIVKSFGREFCSKSCFCKNQWTGVKRTEENKKNCAKSKFGDLNPSKRLEVRNKMSDSAKKRLSVESNKEHLKYWKNKHLSEEHRNKCSQALKGKSYEDLFGKDEADMMKAKRKQEALARTDEQKERALKASCKALGIHPNKFEVRALAYLESLYPNRFSFTGDGSVFINGKSPDALDTKSRIVALFNGIYWHLTKFDLAITDFNKRLVEKIESRSFLEVGYKVIFIWEDEL